MKRLFISILSAIMILFMATGAMAAGSSVTLADAFIKNQRGHEPVFYVITATCVGDDTTGAIADTDIADGETGITLEGPIGWCLYKVIADPGTTTPDDDTDVIIKDTGGNDLLNGNGTGMLDATATNATHPAIDGQAARQPIIGTITLDVNGQTAVDALYVITLIFIRP
jgi:hypothetical protein